MQKRSSCVCGYECRADYMKKHVTLCTAKPIIEKLQAEVLNLRNELRNIPNERNAFKLEISELRRENESLKRTRGDIIENDCKRICTEVAEVPESGAITQHVTQNVTQHVTQHVTQNVTNNIQINLQHITVYGKEEPPKALNILKPLILKNQFISCPAAYLELKHFGNGSGNIRIVNDELEVVCDATGEKRWKRVDKDTELQITTQQSIKEIKNRYGDKAVLYNFANYCKTHNVDDVNSLTFQEMKRTVEYMLMNQK